MSAEYRMVLFAEFMGISDTLWLAVIGVVTLYLKNRADRDRAREAAEMVQTMRVETVTAAEKAVDAAHQVADRLEVATTSADKKLNSIAGDVVCVKAQTNGLIQDLQDQARKEGIDEGIRSVKNQGK